MEISKRVNFNRELDLLSPVLLKLVDVRRQEGGSRGEIDELSVRLHLIIRVSI